MLSHIVVCPIVAGFEFNVMTQRKLYNWKRFWVPRDGIIHLSEDGFLADPESEESIWTPQNHISLETVNNQKCVVLLGEPGIGKTHVLNAFSTELFAAVTLFMVPISDWRLCILPYAIGNI